MKLTRKLFAWLLCLAMLSSMPLALAEDLEMSDVPGMTAPGVYPLVTEPVTLTFGLVPQGNVIDYDTNRFTTWAEEKFGVNIEFFFLPATDTAQKFDMMVAAREKLPDIMVGATTVSDMLYYGQTGYLLSLNEYFDKYAYYYNETLDKYATEAEKAALHGQDYCYDGNRYCFNYATPSVGNDNENMMYVNQKWLEAVGKKVPTTLDELYDVLVAFRDQDPNGNGLKDEIPLVGYNSFDRRGDVVGDLINSFIYYPGGVGADNARCIVNDGVVSTPLVAEEYKEALRFCKKLYDEGLIPEFSFTQTDAQLKTILDRPSTEDTVIGVVATQLKSGTCGFGGCSDEYNKVMEYVALPPLMGPNGVDYAMQQSSGYASTRCYITSSCEHPEVAFRFLDAMCDLENAFNYRYGVQGVDWDWAAEGELDEYGNQAVRKTLASELPWSQNSQNVVWRLENMRMGFASISVVAKPNANPYIQYRTETFNAGVSMRLGHQPAEVFVNPIWNEEENEVVSEYGPNIRSTSNEWRTMFVTGLKDLDKDWDEYLRQLDVLGLKEYLAAAQSCYDRMSGK